MNETTHVIPNDPYFPGSIVLGCNGDFLCIFYQWQTLVAGFLALLAAGVTAFFLSRQISIQRAHLDHEVKREATARQRRSAAARVMLLDALHDLTAYAKKMSRFIYGLGAQTEPNFPTDSLNIVKSSLEHVHPNAIELLSRIVIQCQIFRARVEHPGWKGNEIERAYHLYDIILIHALVDKAYDYGRGKSNDIEDITVYLEEMENSRKVTIHKFYNNSPDSVYDRLVKVISERHSPKPA